MSNKTLRLYKSLIREANKFTSYNFREYAKERIRWEFEQSKNLSDPKKVNELLQKAENTLTSLKRQVVISQLYPVERSVIEKKIHQ